MTPAEILAKCGLTAEAVQKAAQKNARAINGLSLADRNERRYEGLYGGKERDESITHHYATLASSSDNGTCTTRRGTYRHFKRKASA